MARFNAGLIIKDYRAKKGITQEKLSDGVCSVSTLHRIERGKVTPSVFVLGYLMERLGFEAGKYYLSASCLQEFIFINTYNDVEAHVMAQRFDEASMQITKLESAEHLLSKDEGAGIRKQMIMSLQCAISQGKNGDASELFELIQEALLLTLPDFDENRISRYMLSYCEISLINMLATTYKNSGSSERKIKILYQVKDNLDRYYSDDYEKSRGYVQTLYNLSNALGLSSQYEKALEICEIAIQACVKNKRLYLLPHLNFNKGCALFYMGDKETYKNLILESIYALRNNRDFQDSDVRKRFAEKEMGIEFPF